MPAITLTVMMEDVMVMDDHHVVMTNRPSACRDSKSSEGHRKHAGCDQALGQGRSPFDEA
jgi:hypothetical protein